MATIRAYTTIEQSRKLAEILPLESADMHYNDWTYDFYDGYEHTGKYMADLGTPIKICGELDIPCWSLAALLGVLPKGYSLGRRTNGKYYVCMTNIKHNISEFDNSIDACYEMIIKLHELKLL